MLQVRVPCRGSHQYVVVTIGLYLSRLQRTLARQATIPGLKGTGIAVEKRMLNVMIHEDSNSWLAVWVAKVFGMKMS